VTNIGYQGLRLPAGKHAVQLTYRNPLLVPSMIVSLLSMVAAIAVALLRRRNDAIPE
jgi:uncharacterized membrane protein YfhO